MSYTSSGPGGPPKGFPKSKVTPPMIVDPVWLVGVIRDHDKQLRDIRRAIASRKNPKPKKKAVMRQVL